MGGNTCFCRASHHDILQLSVVYITLAVMSTLPLFVASRSAIRDLLSSLQLRRKEEWRSVYVNPATSEEWIQYPLWDYHGPGPNCLRRGSPSLGDALACVEKSENDAEVSAAAYHLANELAAFKENYEPLVERLEAMSSSSPNERVTRNIALAVAWSQVDCPFNHRDPIGKSIEQVNADYAHFAALAKRATALKARAEAALGCEVSQKSTSFE